MDNKILFVDDEAQILTAIKRNFDSIYDIETATSGNEGLELALRNRFSVVISDFKMPGMNGVEFLMKFRELYPDTVRIMLTGQADMDSIVEVINEGNIYRFLTKPCSSEHLKINIDDAIQRYSFINLEKDLLTRTLTGAIQVMTEMLTLARPQAFSRSIRLKEIVKTIASNMAIENAWQAEVAAMLSQIGCITIPGNILEKIYRNLPVPPEHKSMYQKHMKISSEIISRIPRLENIAKLVAIQQESFESGGFSGNNTIDKDSPIEAMILKAAIDYDQLLMMDKKEDEAIAIMRDRKGKYDPKIIDALSGTINSRDTRKRLVKRKVHVTDVADDMILAENVVTFSGIILGEKRQRINKTLSLALHNYWLNREIGDNIEVLTDEES